MSPIRRSLLIVGLIIVFLLSWLRASLGLGIGWTGVLWDTLRVFLPAALLLTFAFFVQRVPREPHIAAVRRDLFGGLETIENRAFWHVPGLFTTLARMPAYPLRFEHEVENIDTRTPGLSPIQRVRVRCVYQVTDALTCYETSLNLYQLIRELRDRERLNESDPELWQRVLQMLMSTLLDDRLRDVVWDWPAEMAAHDRRRVEPLAPSKPDRPTPENDPYALSLNRRRLAEQLLQRMRATALDWGIEVREIVLESITIDPELIRRKTRNKDNEVAEAQHKAKIEAVGIQTRGVAEAAVRARTVRRILEELRDMGELPRLEEKTISDIVRAAMYSDGQTIRGGSLERSNGAGPAKTP
ncbi:MAG: SPFH domain-containing protein [Oscillochloridaceae bacterium]|nr:SPFH domain-containing protein [Chloroflexaceae bacterium]MDW8390555.1 SPFH domain-containing protein [Oscillochloridaceae bacterium]